MLRSRLTQDMKERVLADKDLQKLIAEERKAATSTIYRWLLDEEELITLPVPVMLIKNYFGLKKEDEIIQVYEITEKVVENFTA